VSETIAANVNQEKEQDEAAFKFLSIDTTGSWSPLFPSGSADWPRSESLLDTLTRYSTRHCRKKS
jgi:hypothetical protein